MPSMSSRSYCRDSVTMVTASIHSSGSARRIVQDRKALLFRMNLDSTFLLCFFCRRLINSVFSVSCSTNVLERYFNKDFTLKLPDDKKITEIKWFAVYDLNNQNNFGDIYIPEEFEPPTPQKGNSFSKKSHGVSSGSIEILDSKTIKIPELFYDGLGKRTYFLAGVGPQPSSKGVKIPDEMG